MLNNRISDFNQARYKRALRGYHSEVGKQKALAYIPDYEKFRHFDFFGGNKAFLDDDSKERILEGPAETGKTIACLHFLNLCAWNFPGMQGAILRNVRQDLYGSALVTFHEKVLPRNPIDDPLSLVRAYGGQKPEKYIYPNNSVIWVGGLDKPGGSLSSERDIIYVNQAEEIKETARNKLLTRVTGRAGNMPQAFLIYDANPDDPDHWIIKLHLDGKISLHKSRHKDNPALYKVNPKTGKITDQLTEQGKISLATLRNLTGVDRERLYLGLWARATGLIYGDVWDEGPDGNVTEDADYIPGGGEIYWSVDDGYAGALDDNGYYKPDAHPRAFGLYQLRANGDLCLFYEDYAVKKLSDAHISDIIKYSKEHKIPDPVFVAIDKSAAELKGRIHANGFYTRNSPSSVDESIKEERRWIAPDENGKRRFFVHPRCKHTRREYLVYKANERGDIVKQNDHGPDRDRYLIWALRFIYDG